MSKRDFTVEDARRMIDELGKFNISETSRILSPLYDFIERATRVQHARTTLELFFSAPMQVQTPEKVSEAVAFLVRGVAGLAGDPSALDDVLERVQAEIMAQVPGEVSVVAGTSALTAEELAALGV